MKLFENNRKMNTNNRVWQSAPKYKNIEKLIAFCVSARTSIW